MHQTNVKARANRKLLENDLVLIGFYVENMSCARDIMSCTLDNMSCTRDYMSCARVIMPCGLDNMLCA